MQSAVNEMVQNWYGSQQQKDKRNVYLLHFQRLFFTSDT